MFPGLKRGPGIPARRFGHGTDESRSVLDRLQANRFGTAEIQHAPRLLVVRFLRWKYIDSRRGRGGPSEITRRVVLLVMPDVETRRRNGNRAYVSRPEFRYRRLNSVGNPFSVRITVRQGTRSVPPETRGIVDHSPRPLHSDVPRIDTDDLGSGGLAGDDHFIADL